MVNEHGIRKSGEQEEQSEQASPLLANGESDASMRWIFGIFAFKVFRKFQYLKNRDQMFPRDWTS